MAVGDAIKTLERWFLSRSKELIYSITTFFCLSIALFVATCKIRTKKFIDSVRDIISLTNYSYCTEQSLVEYPGLALCNILQLSPR